MGLLDEAIREHLELKRRHGANPEDVARAEREALGPAVRERAATPIAEPDPAVAETTAAPEGALDDVPEFLSSVPASEPTPEIEPTEAVFPEEPAAASPTEPAIHSEAAGVAPPPEVQAPPPPSEADEPALAPPHAEEPHVDQPTEIFDAGEIFSDEEAEPAEPAAPPAGEAPQDAERDQDASPPARIPPEDGEAEDVLEETPEFLQETPEHERLWFEQKPPRDFDFGG